MRQIDAESRQGAEVITIAPPQCFIVVCERGRDGKITSDPWVLKSLSCIVSGLWIDATETIEKVSCSSMNDKINLSVYDVNASEKLYFMERSLSV